MKLYSADRFLAAHREATTLREAWGKSANGVAMIELLARAAIGDRAGWLDRQGVFAILAEFAERIFQRLEKKVPDLADIVGEAREYIARFVANGSEEGHEDLTRRFDRETLGDYKHVEAVVGSSAQNAVSRVVECASTHANAWSIAEIDSAGKLLDAVNSVARFGAATYDKQEKVAHDLLRQIRISRPTGIESAVLALIKRRTFGELTVRMQSAIQREEARLAEIIREHFPPSAIPAEDAELVAPAPAKPKNRARRYAQLPPDTPYVRIWVFWHDPEFSPNGDTMTIAMVNPVIQANRSLEKAPNLQRRDYVSLSYEELQRMPGIRVLQKKCIPWRVRKEWDIKYLSPFSCANTAEGYEVPLQYMEGTYYFAVNGQ